MPDANFPAESARNAADYVDGFHLTDAEFRLIREELAPESRRFLVKQGHNSVVANSISSGFRR